MIELITVTFWVQDRQFLYSESLSLSTFCKHPTYNGNQGIIGPKLPYYVCDYVIPIQYMYVCNRVSTQCKYG